MQKVKYLAVVLQFWLLLRVWGTVYYVSTTGNDQDDALSWVSAAASVQSALNRASPGDQVWISSGVYHPTEGRTVASAGNLTLYSFQLRDGVSLYGGFTCGESSLEERVLRDLDGNGVVEAWEFSAETILSGLDDSAGQVLYGGLTAFSSEVVIDGISLCNGRAAGSGRNGEGGGALLPGNCLLRCCRVYGNHARRGGGVAILGASSIRQCLLQGNELYLDGWGGEGAGVFLEGEGASLENSLIIGNGVASHGAYLGGGGVAVSGPGKVDFCTIVGNFAVGAGSGVRYSGLDGQLSNSVVWGNQGHACQLSFEEAQLENSAVESSGQIPGCIPLSSCNCGEGGVSVNDNRLHNYYPCFEAPATGNFRLAPGSYLLNRAQAEEGAVDAANRPRNENSYSDIGCFEEESLGNLTADFQVCVPLVYGESALLIYRLGEMTPDLAEATFASSNLPADWQNGGDSRWTIVCWQAGLIELSLHLEATSTISSYWNAFALERILPVLPKSILLQADDLTWQWGSDAPLLTWQIVAGELAGGDTIVGSLQVPEPSKPGRYPIVQGTLSVADGADGANNQLEVLPGVLTCIKGNTEIFFSALEKTYSGYATAVLVESEPPGLEIALTYEGVDGTQYPPSEASPVDAGKYRVTASIVDTYYTAVESALLEIKPAPLLCLADDKTRNYQQDNPTLTVSYQGFLAQDSVADIIEPSAYTNATRLSPVCENGYEIYLQGGSARNYHLEFQSGCLMVCKASPFFNEALLSVGVYGMPLKQILIMAYALSPADGSYLPGYFVWDQEEQVLPAGLWQCTWHFIPDDGQNYQSMPGAGLVTIEKRELRVAALPGYKVYEDPDPTLKYHVAAGSLVDGESFAGSLSRAPGESVGTYSITQGSLALSENYILQFSGDIFQILPRKISVAALDASKYEGQPDPELNWELTGDIPSDSDWVSGSLWREEGEEPGQYQIQQGNLRSSANYTIEFQSGVLTIKGKIYQLMGEMMVNNMVYGEALNGELIQAEVKNAASGEAVPGNFFWEDEGACPATGVYTFDWYFVPEVDEGLPRLSGSAEVEVGKATLHVSCNATLSREYGAKNPPFELSYQGFVFSEDASVLLELPEAVCAANESSLPGEYEIVIDGGRADNYQFEYHSGILQVLPLQIEVTAENQQKEYSQPDPELTFTWQGELLEGDAFTGQLERLPGELPGSYAIDQGTLALPQYYIVTFNPASLQISKIAITVKANNCQIFYGNSLPTLTYKVVSGVLLDSSHIYGNMSCEWTQSPGTYEILQGALCANEFYVLSFLPGWLTVLPRPVTVQANDAKKDYSTDDPSKGFTWKITSGSMRSGDAIIGSLEREVGEEPGEYRIMQGTLDVNVPENYQLTFVEGVFRINKIVPNGYAFPLTVLYHGDILSEVEYVCKFSNRHTNLQLPGTSHLVNGDMRMSEGSSVEEVVFTPEDQVHFTSASTTMLVQIRIRSLQVTVPNQSMVYGDPMPELTWDIGDYEFFPGEEMSGELALLEVNGSIPVDMTSRLAAGEYRIVQGTLLPPPEHYYLRYNPGYLTVSKRIVVVQALDKDKSVGDEDPELSYEIISGSLADGDEFSGQLNREAGELPGTYLIRQGSLALDRNYELIFMEGLFTICETEAGMQSLATRGAAPAQAPTANFAGQELFAGSALSGDFPAPEDDYLTADPVIETTSFSDDSSLFVQVQAVSCDKTYGEQDPIFAYCVLEGSDLGVVLQGDLARQPGEDVGSYSITQGTLHCSNGVGLQFLPGTLRILPKNVAVLAVDQQKYKGEDEPELTWELKGASSSEVQVLGKLTRDKGEEPGAYNIRQGTLQVSGKNHVLDFRGGVLTILPPAYLACNVQAEDIVYGQALRQAKLTGEVIFTDGQELQTGEFIWQQAELIPDSGQRVAAWNFIFADDGIAPLQGECCLNVLQRPLQISGLGQEKRQGEEDPELLYQYSKEDLPDTYLEITGKLSRKPGELAGVYETSLGNLSFGPNYKLDFTPGRLLIQSDFIVVNSDWKTSKKFGDLIDFAGENRRFGADALSDLSEALERVAPGGTVLLLPGEYSSSSGVWHLSKNLRMQGLRRDDSFPVLQSTLLISGASATGIVIEGLAFVQDKFNLGCSCLRIEGAAAKIQLRDNIFLGGNPALQIAGCNDLTLRNNIIESPEACLMFGSSAKVQTTCRGVLLLQNVMRASAEASDGYRHIILHDDQINTTGILPAWNNCYGETQINGDENQEILKKVKSWIADKEQKNWPGKGEVRLRK